MTKRLNCLVFGNYGMLSLLWLKKHVRRWVNVIKVRSNIRLAGFVSVRVRRIGVSVFDLPTACSEAS